MKKTIRVYDWFDGSNHKITIERFDGHYKIMVDGAFWSTAEMFSEVYDEVNDIVNLYQWKYIPII